jgi:hypothetical protein
LQPTTKADDPQRADPPLRSVGFIGLGVMGGAMCRNVVRRRVFEKVLAYDSSIDALTGVLAIGGCAATSAAELAAACDAVVLSLPDGSTSTTVIEQILPRLRAGQLVIDTSTIPVRIAQKLAARCAAAGADYLDAPVARTRDAAEAGTLSVMVGGRLGACARARPILDCIASDITYCGASGNGQVFKILNNMVLFQTVNALAEALAIGERAGVDTQQLFDAFSKGSADSFALRNHGMKAMLRRHFPERAFSARYARKDLACALELADQVGVNVRGAKLVDRVLADADAQGMGEAYFPTILRLHD